MDNHEFTPEDDKILDEIQQNIDRLAQQLEVKYSFEAYLSLEKKYTQARIDYRTAVINSYQLKKEEQEFIIDRMLEQEITFMEYRKKEVKKNNG